jgi:hypothetical protein
MKYTHSILSRSLLAAACLSLSGMVEANLITPTFTSFGELAVADFGGSGIDNNNVAITEFIFGGANVTLGLTATSRFSNPVLTNDGQGTFGATTGLNDGLVGNPTLAATWNFNYFINIVGGSFADLNFDLLFDSDPGVATDESLLGRLDFDQAIIAFPALPSAVSTVQDSQNMTFGFLNTPTSWLTAPAAGGFDPFAVGEYSFALIASDSTGQEVGRSAINVNVTVPEPETLGLLAIAMAGLIIRRRRH